MALAGSLTYAGAAWLELLHRAAAEPVDHRLPYAVAVARDGSLALPLVVAAVAVSLSLCLARTVGGRGLAVAVVAPAAAAAWVLATTAPLFGAVLGTSPRDQLLLGLLTDLLAVFPACLLAGMAAVPVAWPSPRLGSADPGAAAAAGAGHVATSFRGRPTRITATRATVVGLVMAAGAPLFALSPAQANPGSGVCANASRTLTYDVVAMEVDLPMNGWGDHIPDGMIYALANADAFPNAEDIRREPGRATPLVLRAAVGDCIKVRFTNQISGRRVGMHVDGVAKSVTGGEASDGARVGHNPDGTAAYNQTRTYTWYASRAGQFPINDYGSGTDFGRNEPSTDTTSHGLYGGLVVLPAGYTWHEETTGRNLLSFDAGTGSFRGVGAPVFADARGPRRGDDFRDVALVFMDEPEGVVGPDGQTPKFPHTGVTDVSFGFNYRTEPLRNRLQAVLDHNDGTTVTLPNGTVILPQDHFCDGWTNDQTPAANQDRLGKDLGVSGCQGEESHLQSWTFGDPGKITKSIDEVDVLALDRATGGSFTLTLKDPTLTGPLTAKGEVDQDAPRFLGEVTTTAPIPYPARAADVKAALMQLKVLPMAELHPDDIEVVGGPNRFSISFGQHFAGRDVDLSVDGSGLVNDPAEPPANSTQSEGSPAATVRDTGDGARRGQVIVLSDALIPHAYRGDGVHVRLIHPGVKETHPFHQHTNRWRQESEDENSTRLDVQSIGPGQAMELAYEGGAGEAITADPANPAAGPKSASDWLADGRPDLAALAITKASNGDQIFHCHLYPHFAQGFWGTLRVFDRQRPVDQDLWPAATPRTYPDATPIEPLFPLPDFDLTAVGPAGQEVSLTPMPDAAHPGFPLMVKGEYLQRAYRAPGAVVADRFGDAKQNWRRPGDTVRDYGDDTTTDLERANMVTSTVQGERRAIPGSFFIDPCPRGAPVREYHPTAIDAKIVYNDAGWHDPNGKLYVEAPPSDPARPETAIDTAATIRQRINAGRVRTEPYNMRSRLGE